MDHSVRECALGVTFCPSLSLGPNLRVLPCTSNSLGGRIILLGSALYCIIGVLFRYYFRLFPKFQSWSSADSTFGELGNISTFDFFNGRETWSLVNWGTFPWGSGCAAVCARHTVFSSKRRKNSSLCVEHTASLRFREWGTLVMLWNRPWSNPLLPYGRLAHPTRHYILVEGLLTLNMLLGGTTQYHINSFQHRTDGSWQEGW